MLPSRKFWEAVFSILFITCQQPIPNFKSINFIHDLNQKLLPRRKKEQKNILVDSEIRIGCWHAMNKWSNNFIQTVTFKKLLTFSCVQACWFFHRHVERLFHNLTLHVVFGIFVEQRQTFLWILLWSIESLHMEQHSLHDQLHIFPIVFDFRSDHNP